MHSFMHTVNNEPSWWHFNGYQHFALFRISNRWMRFFWRINEGISLRWKFDVKWNKMLQLQKIYWVLYDCGKKNLNQRLHKNAKIELNGVTWIDVSNNFQFWYYGSLIHISVNKLGACLFFDVQNFCNILDILPPFFIYLFMYRKKYFFLKSFYASSCTNCYCV